MCRESLRLCRRAPDLDRAVLLSRTCKRGAARNASIAALWDLGMPKNKVYPCGSGGIARTRAADIGTLPISLGNPETWKPSPPGRARMGMNC